jgi:hypothetical protein
MTKAARNSNVEWQPSCGRVFAGGQVGGRPVPPALGFGLRHSFGIRISDFGIQVYASGSRTDTVVSLSGSEEKQISPWCAVTIHCAMLKPSPQPSTV